VIETVDLSLFGNKARRTLSASAPAEICLTTELRDFAGFWPRSDRLGSARCYAFQCAEILELQCETFARVQNAEPLFVAVLGQSGEPLALIPLCLHRYSRFTRIFCIFKQTRVLRFLGGGLTDYNAPVVFPPVRDWDIETVRTIWKGLRKVLPAFDIAMLERMPDRVLDLPNPLIMLGTSSRGESGHAMTLSGTWQDFAGRLPNRHTLRNRISRVSERGKLTFEIAETSDQYDAFLEGLIRQKRRRHLETQGVGVPDGPGYRAYLTMAKRLRYPSGPVCLFALKVNDCIIATIFGYVVGSRFSAEIFSFDTAWRSYSPGRISFIKMFEWCFAKGLDVFDFGAGDEAYKNGYCDVAIALREAAIPANAKGVLLLCGRTVIDWIRDAERRLQSLSQLRRADA